MSLSFNKKITGFTLIELVIVIAILGILAAVAIPKLFNITTDAQSAAIKGVAGALSSANSENYAIRTENSTKGQAVVNCTDVSGLLVGGMPSGYTITASSVAVNVTATCTLTGPGANTILFNATGIN